jgi:CRP/FNR family transcriptional regulator, cyclic AMP receptor protein
MNVIEHFRNARNVKEFPAGTVLFREGEAGQSMYLLLDGFADVTVGAVQVELATPGAILGEMALIDSSARSASVVCRSRCKLVPVDRAAFDLLVQETPAFARHVMAVLAERMRRMNERLRETVAEGSIHR